MERLALQARPTVYNGIQMRSRLEAGFAVWLDRWKVEWTYEPRAFADATGQHLPDFTLEDVRVLGAVEPLYIEVKPGSFDVRKERPWLISRAEMIKSSEPRANLGVAIGPNGPAASQLHLVVNDHVVPASWIMESRQDELPMLDTSPSAYASVDELSIAVVTHQLEQAMAPWRLRLAVGLSPTGPWYGEWWKGSAG